MGWSVGKGNDVAQGGGGRTVGGGGNEGRPQDEGAGHIDRVRSPRTKQVIVGAGRAGPR